VIDPRTREAFIHTASAVHAVEDGNLRTSEPGIGVPVAEILGQEIAAETRRNQDDEQSRDGGPTEQAPAMFRVLGHQHDPHRKNVGHQQQLQAQQNVVEVNQRFARLRRQNAGGRNQHQPTVHYTPKAGTCLAWNGFRVFL
jgi:hypothetical protein